MRAEEFLEKYRKQMLEDLAALVKIDSVEGTAAPGAPFGQGPRRALDKALEIAKRLGLLTQDGDGYLGWAQAQGKCESPYLASITHLDVVPAGNGWTGEPFALRRKEGVLLGRGVSDDKGPSVLMLYAAKYLQDEGVLRYPFRVLLGCSEETGMQDVPYYLARNPQPAFLFSPDGDFPVCNGEKGIFSAVLQGSWPQDSRIVSFTGGGAENMVPDRAEALVRIELKALAPQEGICAAAQPGGLVKLEAFGVGGHAAMPADTRNAIGMLAAYLTEQKLINPAEKPYFALLRRLFESSGGEALGIAFKKEPFTPLTCVGSVMRMEKGTYRQTLNIRYPAGITGAELARRLRQAAGDSARLCDIRDDAPFYISADNPAIKALLDVYAKHTGKPAAPFTMGGGTYARHFKNAVSFGMEQPKELLPAFAGPIHGADEALGEDWFFDAFLIYVDAIQALQKLDF